MKELFCMFFEAFFQSLKAHTVLNEHVDNNQVIHNYLRGFNDGIGADRLMVHQFHNGGHFYNGVSIQKSSCTYEILNPGISSEMRAIKDVLISENTEFHSRLLNQGSVKYPDIKECTQISLRASLEKRAVVSYYAFAIRNIRKEQVGFLTLDFIKDQKELTKEQIESIEETCSTLAGYLNTPQSVHKIQFYVMQATALLLLSLAFGQVFDIMIRMRAYFGW